MNQKRLDRPRAWAAIVLAWAVGSALGCGGGNPITDPITDPLNDALDDAFDDALDQFEDEFFDSDDSDAPDFTPASVEGRTLILNGDNGEQMTLMFVSNSTLTRQNEPAGGGQATSDGAGFVYEELSNTTASLAYTVTDGVDAGLVAAVSLIFDDASTGRFLGAFTPPGSAESSLTGTIVLQ